MRKPRWACSWSQEDSGRMVPWHKAEPPQLNPAGPGPAKPSPPAAPWECVTTVLREPPTVQVACHAAFLCQQPTDRVQKTPVSVDRCPCRYHRKCKHSRLQALGSSSRVRALENRSPESIFTSRAPVPPGKGEPWPRKIASPGCKGKNSGPRLRRPVPVSKPLPSSGVV